MEDYTNSDENNLYESTAASTTHTGTILKLNKSRKFFFDLSIRWHYYLLVFKIY